MLLNYNQYRYGLRKKGRRRGLLPALIVAILAAGVAVPVLLILTRAWQPFPAEAVRGGVKDLAALWQAKRYDEVIRLADQVLKTSPLDRDALSYRGFASFYKAVADESSEEKAANLDQAVVSLRRAQIMGSAWKEESDYVLGKAYFHKGLYYLDLSVAFMENSVVGGLVMQDSYEYLGLAYTQLGELEKGLQYFLRAMDGEGKGSDLLLLTIGQSYYQMKRTDEAVGYLTRALDGTEDEAISRKARFLLGEIYMERQDLDRAEEQYLAIVKADPRSAEAHFNLGEIYAKRGDQVKARGEWRTVLLIDPTHVGAKLRYYK
jgi:tetratricopeptide (TPR) repeat protein